jgi:hypothetical protein
MTDPRVPVNRCETCGTPCNRPQRWCSYDPCARIALERVGEPKHDYGRRRWPIRLPVRKGPS